MIWLNIIWPVFAMAALIFGVWITVAVVRLNHVRRTPPTSAEAFATGDEMRRYFAPVELANDNLVNLLQMPVLFFVVALLMIVTHATSVPQVVLAWAYVLLRAVHTAIHIRVRHVRARFLVHVASNAVLSAMWIGLFVDMATEAARFHQAMQAVAQP